MDINGINIQVAKSESSPLLAANGDTAGALKSRRSALSDSAGAGSSQASSAHASHVHTSLIDSNYIKEQIHSIMYDFPPFFPAGTPQRLDLIKGIQAVQEERKSSTLPTGVKEKLTGQELTAASTDKDISAALKGVRQFKEEHSPALSQSTGNGQTTKIVSINV